MKKLFLLGIFIPGCCLALSAQFSFKGIISNEKQQKLYGVQVAVTLSDIVQYFATDKEGYFELYLPQGAYQAQLIHPQYDTLGIQLKITPDNDQVTPFVMSLRDDSLDMLPKHVQRRSPYLPGVSTTSSVAKPNTVKSIVKRAKLSDVKGSGSYSFIHDLNPDIRYDAKTEDTHTVRSDSAALALVNSGLIKEEVITELVYENPFQSTDSSQISTFSIDVDVAAYANIRRMLNSRFSPVSDDVRIEEMINYFDYHYPEPTGDDPIEMITELQPCPWEPTHHLLMIGLQGKKIETPDIPASNLTFLIDVSGSMDEPEKLPLVKSALNLLIDQLRPQDQVSIVVYAGAAGLVLDAATGDQKAIIQKAIEELHAGGSTAGGAGIQLAYELARKHFIQNGNNRLILCTDGDFNVGISKNEELVQLIEKERNSGVYLTVLGFGNKNYQDKKMQELADHGNGNHAYIDNLAEARKVLISEFGGTLYTIAKDVKLQVDFNPNQVSMYRLIGYENRVMANEDFNNDKKDAGDMGAGHSVTALYEVITSTRTGGDPLGELASIKFRYKQPEGEGYSKLIERNIPAVCAARQTDNFKLAAAVAEFGLLLRNSPNKGNANWSQALEMAQKAAVKDGNGYRTELIELIKIASRL